MNHILAICDTEEEYASKLADYLNLKEGFPFHVIFFANPDRLEQFVKKKSCQKIKELLCVNTNRVRPL